MAKLKDLFEIDNYTLKENFIVVDILEKDREKEVKIPRNIYESWMKDSGRLEWVYDTGNYRGEHIQEIGTLDIEDYWQDIMVDKRSDLYDFIALKKPLSDVLGGHFFTALNAAI